MDQETANKIQSAIEQTLSEVNYEIARQKADRWIAYFRSLVDEPSDKVKLQTAIGQIIIAMDLNLLNTKANRDRIKKALIRILNDTGYLEEDYDL